MKINILLALLFVLVGCENDVKPLWLSGSWKGTFKDTYTSTVPKNQFIDQPAYPAELFYKVSTNSATVTYPTLGCTSNWAFVKTDNDTVFFEEKITSDKNNVGCVDGMQYKLFQLSKNEVVILGNGKTQNGSLIEANGVLAKVDYASKKTTLSAREEETPQNTSSKTSNENPDKPSINKSEQTGQDPTLKAKSGKESQSLATNTDNSIVGIWKNHEVTEKYGFTSWMTIIWEFKPNFTSKLRVRTENGYRKGNISTWNMTGTKLQTTVGEKIERYNIVWDDNNFLGFTLFTEGILNNRHFSKISTNPYANDENSEPDKNQTSSNKKNSMTCPRCNGSGHHACSLFTGDPYMNDLDFARCMSTNAADQTQVTCYMCKGLGIWRY